MIASRLLSILLRLQQGPVTARSLADDLEVSLRTIYRDLDQLSYAGIPVYCERGRNGGIRLDVTWSNRSFGFTPSEIEALLAANEPDLLHDLGLNLPLSDAQRKLFLAMPHDNNRPATDRARRILIDPVPWYRHRDLPDALKAVAMAVWEQRQLAFGYTSWAGRVDRVVEPLGLVLKAGVWYLVAGCDGSIRTYRVGQMDAVKFTGECSVRPDDFNLAAHWQLSTSQFEQNRQTGTAALLITTEGLRRLDRMGVHVVSAACSSLGKPDPDGWMTASIPIENVEHATYELLALGRHVQIVSPPELKVAFTKELKVMQLLVNRK